MKLLAFVVILALFGATVVQTGQTDSAVSALETVLDHATSILGGSAS